jgi:hypothetical protein
MHVHLFTGLFKIIFWMAEPEKLTAYWEALTYSFSFLLIRCLKMKALIAGVLPFGLDIKVIS